MYDNIFYIIFSELTGIQWYRNDGFSLRERQMEWADQERRRLEGVWQKGSLKLNDTFISKFEFYFTN